MSDLKKTPLHDNHLALKGKMVPFAGFSMPVQYGKGALKEYHSVRGTGAGLFDISHMGQVRVRGVEALTFLQYASTNNVASLVDGQVQYAALLNKEGTFIDDITIYRVEENHYYLCVNAGNRDKDVAHLQALAVDFDVAVTDESDATTLLALQGESAQRILQGLSSHDLENISYYHFALCAITLDTLQCTVLVSRTGYTGEDGFELYIPNHAARPVWCALIAAGAEPIGLAARDMLRSEMGYALYGHEINAEVTPVEARLMWITKLDKGDFLGRAAVLARKEAGASRYLVALQLTGRGIAREGYPVLHQGILVGNVTTGQYSPLAETGIALAYIDIDPSHAQADDFAVEIRNKAVAAKVTALPFVRSRVRRSSK
ncbi:MAG: glycine cleavage system aminomethyltransferase GcvT [Mariprofundaceae bacterium]|nr:glycine cleavage system aminomethyltransferase GcvT [Mariprofundaceae bacterium]